MKVYRVYKRNKSLKKQKMFEERFYTVSMTSTPSEVLVSGESFVEIRKLQDNLRWKHTFHASKVSKSTNTKFIIEKDCSQEVRATITN